MLLVGLTTGSQQDRPVLNGTSCMAASSLPYLVKHQNLNTTGFVFSIRQVSKMLMNTRSIQFQVGPFVEACKALPVMNAFGC